MDNLFEIIVPLIFAAIYILSSIFGKSKKDEELPQASEVAERQRKIQEEIKRRNAERQRQAQPPEPPVQLERQQPQRLGREVIMQQPVPSAQVHSTPSSSSSSFSWDSGNSSNAYENPMQTQRDRIEATREQAEQLKRQVPKANKGNSESSSGQSSSRSILSGKVRGTLNGPKAARIAFIYGEVLGQPISQRKSSSVPGLN